MNWSVSKCCSRTSRCKCVAVPYSKENLKVLFKRYDSDGDGRLSYQELKNAFTSFGSKAAWWRAHRALARADKNGDGYVSEDEIEDLLVYTFGRGYTIK